MVTNTAPIPALLNTWADGPAGPAVTWYGPDSERVELTGGVLANWVTKATNLLQEEADAAPGVRVELDLPPHWRTLVWALAVWNCGAEVVFPTVSAPAVSAPAVSAPAASAPAVAAPAVSAPAAGPSGVDVQVSVVPPAASSAVAPPAPPAPSSADTAHAPVRIAVALPALARQVDDLPPGAIDGAAELMSQPDVLVSPPEWDPQAPALAEVAHGELGAPSALGELGAPGALGELGAGRYLLSPETADAAVRQSLAVWCAGGSVVLVGNPTADIDRIAAQEDAHPLD